MIKIRKMIKMCREDYDKIVKEILNPLAEEILTSENNIYYEAVELTKKFDEKLFKIFNKYIIYFCKSALYDISESNLTRHKLAACLIGAIEFYSPFTISPKGNSCENLFFANELLAIYSGISFLECFDSNINISFPRISYTSRDINPYIKTLCQSLFNRKKQIKNDISYLASILLLLECLSFNKYQ